MENQLLLFKCIDANLNPLLEEKSSLLLESARFPDAWKPENMNYHQHSQNVSFTSSFLFVFVMISLVFYQCLVVSRTRLMKVKYSQSCSFHSDICNCHIVPLKKLKNAFYSILVGLCFPKSKRRKGRRHIWNNEAAN